MMRLSTSTCLRKLPRGVETSIVTVFEPGTSRSVMSTLGFRGFKASVGRPLTLALQVCRQLPKSNIIPLLLERSNAAVYVAVPEAFASNRCSEKRVRFVEVISKTLTS